MVQAAVSSHRTAPVRGTQSFVGVMAAVWKRPSLSSLEIAWRWSFGVLAFAFVWFFARGTMLVWIEKFRNIEAILARGSLVARLLNDVYAQVWPLVAGIAIWGAFAGIGRGIVLKRWDSSLQARRGTMIVLAMIRAYSFAGLLALWFAMLIKLARMCVWTPMDRGLQPSYVPGFAVAVTGTLLLFMLWALVSWVVRIAPVLAISRGLGAFASLRASVGIGALRSKLIEVNLVMGIVKVALIVLAMVFSACPLPFESVESQTFLMWWWIGVGVLYVIASDYFHVVRAAAYDALYRLHESGPSEDPGR